MPENQIPQEPGYYWAKWESATAETPEKEDCTPTGEWEIVAVDSLASSWNPWVLVPGVNTAQEIEGFFWGTRVADLNAGMAS